MFIADVTVSHKAALSPSKTPALTLFVCVGSYRFGKDKTFKLASAYYTMMLRQLLHQRRRSGRLTVSSTFRKVGLINVLTPDDCANIA